METAVIVKKITKILETEKTQIPETQIKTVAEAIYNNFRRYPNSLKVAYLKLSDDYFKIQYLYQDFKEAEKKIDMSGLVLRVDLTNNSIKKK